jgi:hypothetical protein
MQIHGIELPKPNKAQLLETYGIQADVRAHVPRRKRCCDLNILMGYDHTLKTDNENIKIYQTCLNSSPESNKHGMRFELD